MKIASRVRAWCEAKSTDLHEAGLQLESDSSSAAAKTRFAMRIHGAQTHDRRGFHSASQHQTVTAFGVILTLVMILIGATASASGAIVFSFVAAAVLAVRTFRAWLAGVEVQADRVSIRGILRTRRIEWADLQCFSFGSCGVFPAVGIAELRDGNRLPITGIATGRVARNRTRAQAEAVIAELNQVLAQHQ
jgi:Bacterial PH domain